MLIIPLHLLQNHNLWTNCWLKPPAPRRLQKRSRLLFEGVCFLSLVTEFFFTNSSLPKCFRKCLRSSWCLLLLLEPSFYFILSSLQNLLAFYIYFCLVCRLEWRLTFDQLLCIIFFRIANNRKIMLNNVTYVLSSFQRRSPDASGPFISSATLSRVSHGFNRLRNRWQFYDIIYRQHKEHMDDPGLLGLTFRINSVIN